MRNVATPGNSPLPQTRAGTVSLRGAVLRQRYPLQERFLLMGAWMGLLAGLLFFSVIAGFTVFVLFTLIGTLWRRDEIPSLSFCLAYQWLFATAGYLSYLSSGIFPGFTVPGNVELAVFLSMISLLILVLGVRVAWYGWDRYALAHPQEGAPAGAYDVRRLFWWVVVTYTTNWFVSIHPMGIAFNFSQIIGNLLSLRTVLLFLLLVTAVRTASGYRYAIAGLVYPLLPSLGSAGSAFGGFLMIGALAVLSGWRPWDRSRKGRLISRRSISTLAVLGGVLVSSAVVWQGAVKLEWRRQLRTGTVSESPTERLREFLDTSTGLTRNLDVGRAFESLAERTSSGLGFFSHVLLRVPESIPHTGGTLTLRAIEHVSKPRFLFPGKPGLGSDSWLVRRYAGYWVAGQESNTSVGLGYMAEFYIDFGIPLMFVPLFIYGILTGFLYALCFRVSPSGDYGAAMAAVLFCSHFMSYEGEVAKLLGGLLQTFLVFGTVTVFIGPRLHRWLGGTRPHPPLQPATVSK